MTLCNGGSGKNLETVVWSGSVWLGLEVIASVNLVLVLIKDRLNHQKDAFPKGIRIPGLLSNVNVYKLT